MRTREKGGWTMEEKKILHGCYMAFALNGMVSLSVGTLLPYLTESYGIGYQASGVLLGLHSVGTLAATLLMGVLPFWVGRRRSACAISLLGIVAFLSLLAGPMPLFLGLGFLLTGLTKGSCSNTGNTVVGLVAPGNPVVMNMLHASVALGAFSCPFLALLCARGLGVWQVAAVVLALGQGLQFLIFRRMDMPEEHRRSLREGGVTFVRNPRFWVAALILFFYMCAEQGINGWLVTYFRDVGLMSDGFAQGMASVLWLFILVGRLICATMGKRLRPSALLILNATGYLVCFTCLMNSTRLFPIAASIMGLGLFMAGIFPCTVACASAAVGGEPLAMTVVLTFSNVGAAVMPTVIGAVAERAGIAGGMSTLTAVVAVTLGMILVNRLLDRRETARIEG